MLTKILDFSKELILKKVNSDSICCDMTCGRGNDTIFLARNVKKVYSFDIQEDAINYSKNICKDFSNITFINDRHENVKNYVSCMVDCFIFNLGYLPKGDKKITTKAVSTLNAIKNCLDLLSVGGIIIICCYPGHDEGMIESKMVVDFLQSLNQKEYDCIKYDFINQVNNPPFLLAIEKLK